VVDITQSSDSAPTFAFVKLVTATPGVMGTVAMVCSPSLAARVFHSCRWQKLQWRQWRWRWRGERECTMGRP
jgi:hypothetical protein